MAKKVIELKKRRTTINGVYVDEMTQEQKTALIARNPSASKLFESK